jgi:hypothetical protein
MLYKHIINMLFLLTIETIFRFFIILFFFIKSMLNINSNIIIKRL